MFLANVLPTWANLLCFWANFQCCKWVNNLAMWSHCWWLFNMVCFDSAMGPSRSTWPNQQYAKYWTFLNKSCCCFFLGKIGLFFWRLVTLVLTILLVRLDSLSNDSERYFWPASISLIKLTQNCWLTNKGFARKSLEVCECVRTTLGQAALLWRDPDSIVNCF